MNKAKNTLPEKQKYFFLSELSEGSLFHPCFLRFWFHSDPSLGVRGNFVLLDPACREWCFVSIAVMCLPSKVGKQKEQSLSGLFQAGVSKSLSCFWSM